MDLMPRFSDGFFDLAIIDPPFGNGTAVERGTGHYAEKYVPKGKKWDKAPGEDYFAELFRVAKHQVIFGAQFFGSLLPVRRGWICWYKSDEVKGRSFSEFELAWTSWDRACRHFTCKPFLKDGRRYHPNQKPVELYAWILASCAKPGFKVLDTHMGSGSSVIACHNAGLDVWACEIDADYFKDAKRRVDDVVMQQELFPADDKAAAVPERTLFDELMGGDNAASAGW
jgi:site-specific DNA-methyltransferase (adenine-specific)